MIWIAFMVGRLVMRVWAALVLGLAFAPVVAWAETVTYSYDALGRLVKVVHSGGPVSGTQVTYTHDAASNRTRVQVTGAPH